MAITTGFISNIFGKDIGNVFYPLSGKTPIANTGLQTNDQSGDDLAALFMPITDGYGTSTSSGFHSDAHGGDDLSLLFAIGLPATASNASTDLIIQSASVALTLSTYATGSDLTYDFVSVTSNLVVVNENTSTGDFDIAWETGTVAGTQGSIVWSCSNPQSSSAQATWTFTAKSAPPP